MYTRDEVYESTMKYFNQDELATTTWMNKYCLKDLEGNYLELNPDQMHHRLATEFKRIEDKYQNPMSYEEIYNLLKDFKFVIPQGSPMCGIGNTHKISSLSNCFVIGEENTGDSYGGIMKSDEEVVQISKRRGGVGLDMSNLRPEGALVTNDANTSSGVVSYMNRYSNSTREVGQQGRRGALMLTLLINHPDAESFIDSKLDLNKITGANISIKLTDEFIEAAFNYGLFYQTFPTHLPKEDILPEDLTNYEVNKLYPGKLKKSYFKIIDANVLWNKIVHNAWKSAEPGILLWDNILRESPADCYAEEGYRTLSTNPCFSGDSKLKTNVGELELDQLVAVENLYAYNSKNELVKCKVFLTKNISQYLKLKFINYNDGSITFIKCTFDHKFPCYKIPSDALAELEYIGDFDAINLLNKSVKIEYSRLKGLNYSTCIGIEVISENINVYDFSLEGDDHYGWINGILVHNCGELPLCPYDSCRLMTINLYSYVINPFTPEATFDFKKLKSHTIKAQRLMDDLIDLELEKITQIIAKIKSDPEPKHLKLREIQLWEVIHSTTKRARRTGLGTTGNGDMLAALGLQYGSEESIEFLNKIFEVYSKASYESSIIMAKERGAFEIFNYDKECEHQFLNRVITDSKLKTAWKKYGRRNIANLTLAPTGSTSILTQTTSGIEPVFSINMVRRRKTSDVQLSVYKDATGDMFEEFVVWHHKYLDWFRITKHPELTPIECIDILKNKSQEELDELYESSPYYQSTAKDIDWINKVKLQGTIQKWIDHSISCTVNIPNSSTESLVSKIYKTAYEVGCKGCTIYRDGSRDGIFITESSTITNSKVRPPELPCEVVRFKNGTENWIAFIGMRDNKPYELFTGKIDDDIKYLPKSITSGILERVEDSSRESKSRYDFHYKINFGYVNVLPDVGSVFNIEFSNYARLVSGMLREGIKIEAVVTILEGMYSKDTIHVWNRGVARALRAYVKDGTKAGKNCPTCNAELIYESGCCRCASCGWEACD